MIGWLILGLVVVVFFTVLACLAGEIHQALTSTDEYCGWADERLEEIERVEYFRRSGPGMRN